MNEQLAGLRPAHRDALRLTGAVLFAAGAMALFVRKDSQDQWAAFPKLLIVAIPCVLLYGLGIGALRIGRADDDDPADPRGVPAWRATALTLGLILVPFVLAQLITTLGGDPDNSWHTTWMFLATAAAGAYAAFVHGLRWGALFAGLALIISWIAFWDAITDPSATAIRWLFIVVGVLLALAAYVVDRDGRRDGDASTSREGPELVTAAGIAGLAAGITGLVAIVGQVFADAAASAFGGDTDLTGAQQRQEWDVFLLLLALALIWYGGRAAWRGPVYVGAITLAIFVISVGAEITALFSGDGQSGDVVGWPLLLLVLGGAGLLAGLLGGGDRTTDPEPPPPPPAPPAPATPPPPQP